MTTNVDQGFSTIEKLQPKKLTIRKLRARNVFLPCINVNTRDLINSYGAVKEEDAAKIQRSTVLIDKEGKVAAVWNPVRERRGGARQSAFVVVVLFACFCVERRTMSYCKYCFGHLTMCSIRFNVDRSLTFPERGGTLSKILGTEEGRSACYLSSGEATAAYPRSRGIPVLANVDDPWYGNLSSAFRCPAKVQWLPTAKLFTGGCWSLIEVYSLPFYVIVILFLRLLPVEHELRPEAIEITTIPRRFGANRTPPRSGSR